MAHPSDPQEKAFDVSDIAAHGICAMTADPAAANAALQSDF